MINAAVGLRESSRHVGWGGLMPAVVLESKFGSRYDDSPTSYEFPPRYLPFFQPLTRGEPIYAVIYEPRGDGSGRLAYVGWALISDPPRLSGRTTESGAALWRVEYLGAAESFDEPVPREIDSVPIESWLHDLPRGRMRNSATRGRAVRSLPDAEFQRILQLGHAGILGGAAYPVLDEHATPTEVARERSLRMVEALRRDAHFREVILGTYGYRCAISGFELGRVSKTKPQGLIDAAHIRPVWRNGPDDPSNGIPLTPTLHRFFDAGLFTIEYRDGHPTVLTSTRLEPAMIAARDGDFRLPLRDGLRLLVPGNRAAWPSPEQLRFHRREVFQSA